MNKIFLYIIFAFLPLPLAWSSEPHFELVCIEDAVVYGILNPDKLFTPEHIIAHLHKGDKVLTACSIQLKNRDRDNYSLIAFVLNGHDCLSGYVLSSSLKEIESKP